MKKAKIPIGYTLNERKAEKLLPIKIKGISSFIKGGQKETYLSGTQPWEITRWPFQRREAQTHTINTTVVV